MLSPSGAYTTATFLAAGVSLAVAARVYGRREPYAESFVGLMIAIAAWSGLYGVQLLVSGLATRLSVFRVIAVVGATVPTLWLWFTVQYTGADWLADAREVLLLEPAVFVVAVVTNPAHGLVWGSPRLAVDTGVTSLIVTFGPGFLLHATYSYLLVAVGLVLVARVAVTGPVVSARQSALLMLGAVPPFVVNVVELLVGGPIPVDTTPFAFVVTGVVWGLALFQFDLLRRTAPARRQALEGVDSGLIVTDETGEVVEIDELARRVFDGEPTVGDSLQPTVADGAGSPSGLDGGDRTAVIDDRRRVFDTTVEPLSDHRGRTTGYAVVVHDVTARHASRKRLEVANRVLRHNLSNDLNVVVGYANHVTTRSDDSEVREAATKIHAAATGLLETSEKARVLVNSETSTTDPVAVELTEPTRRVVEQFESVADVRLSVTDATATVESRRDYRTALSNLVENAVEHHDGDPTVWVEVTTDTDADEVVVAVADDGPGVPDTDRLAVVRGTETPLEHASGLGLWIARWTATAVGGELSISDREPRGTRVELRLPSAES